MSEKEYYLKLLSTNRFIKQIYENHPGIIVFISKDGKIKLVNNKFLDLTGYSEDEIIDKNFFEIFIEKEEKVEDYFGDIINKKTEDPHFHINHIITRDKRRPLIMWANFYVEDENNNLLGTISFGYDITFKNEYIEDVKKINSLILSFSENFDENIRKTIDFAKEISGAKFVMFNRVKGDNIYVEYASGIKDYPLELPLEGTLCERALNSKDLQYDTFISDDIKNEFLSKNGIIKYYGVVVDVVNRYGTLCFFFDKDIHIKKNRIFFLSSILAAAYRRKEFVGEILSEKEKFFSLLESLPLGVVYADRKTREIIYVNKKLADIVEHPIDLIKGKNLDFLKNQIVDKGAIEDFALNPHNYPAGIRLKGITPTGEEKTIHYWLGDIKESDKLLLILADVTYEQRRVERLNDYTKKLMSFSQIDNILIKNSSDKIYSEVLNFIKTIFNAEYGLIGNVDFEKKEFIVKHMSGDVVENCHIGDVIDYKKFIDSKSIWAQTIIKSKTMILNRPVNIEGHIPIKNAISLPLFFREKIIGALMLANREGGWNAETVEKLEELVNYISSRIYYIFENEELIKKGIEENIKKLNIESIIKMTGGIAHNINNMLVPLISNTSFIKEKLEKSNCPRDIYKLVDESLYYLESLSGISNELLNIANPKVGLPEVIDMNHILKVIDVVSKGLFLEPNIKIFDLAKDLKINVDKSQLFQVITNIIKNASESMKDKGISRIDIEINKFGIDNNDFLSISIRDYGTGIKNDDKSKIFNLYHTTKTGGKGLGLFMSKRIIENMGGYIDFESEYGKGTKFNILIPVFSENMKMEIKKEMSLDIEKVKDLKIIIIDDEDYIIKSLNRLFSNFGITYIKGASNSNDSIDLIKNEKFNIAIIDMILKNDIRGDALNRKIKEVSPDIFSVVSTGYSDDDVMGDILKYGFNYKLPKPYKLKDIENFLKFYIEWSKK